MEYSEKVINSEEDLVNIIKGTDLNKLKEIFKYINVSQLPFFKIFYYIFSYDIIKFFIEP